MKKFGKFIFSIFIIVLALSCLPLISGGVGDGFGFVGIIPIFIIFLISLSIGAIIVFFIALYKKQFDSFWLFNLLASVGILGYIFIYTPLHEKWVYEHVILPSRVYISAQEALEMAKNKKLERVIIDADSLAQDDRVDYINTFDNKEYYIKKSVRPNLEELLKICHNECDGVYIVR